MGKYNANARRNFVNESYFEQIDTEEKAYWLGFIQADGCIYKQETTFRFQMNLSGADYDHLSLFNKCLESTYKVSRKKVTVKGREYEACSVKINSKPFCEHLMNNGIEMRKTLNDAFPELDGNMMKHFIRGFLDGDGNIKVDRRSKNPRITVRFAGGEGFLIKLRDYLVSEGFLFAEKSVRKIGASQAYELSFSGRENMRLFYEYMYSGTTICLDRKRAKFKEALDEIV